MKKIYSLFSILFFLFCFQITSAQVLTFSFAGIVDAETSWPSNYEAAGVQPSTITRGSGVVASAADDRFNSKNWTTASSVDLTDYLEFTITPMAGYSVTISNIVLLYQVSTSAPKTFVIRTSLDNYASDATNVVNATVFNTPQNSTFSFTSPIVTTSPVTIRIYAYNASNASGSWGPGVGGSDIVVSGTQTVLPVNFANVKAIQKNNGVEISWTNLTESDVRYYSVEWSSNGQSFTELAKVNPTQNNNGSADYKFFDTHPLSKTNFYRIKGVETTGRLIYSIIMKIETGATNRTLGIYPNPAPAGSQMAIQMNSLPSGNYTVRIYNASAQLMRSQTITVTGGSLTQTLSLSNWQKGMYVLEISGSVNLKKRFIVQ